RPSPLILAGLFLTLLYPATAHAVVAVDTSSSGTTETHSLTFSHTTGNILNGYLVVGVSIDVLESGTASVGSIAYGGASLTLIGLLNNPNGARVEMWGLQAPEISPGPAAHAVVVTLSGAT